jgi:hypothetical protein
MSAKSISLFVSLVGLVIALVFIFADVIGLGSNPNQFGPLQSVGTVVGAVILVVGLYMYMRQRRS